MDRLVILLAMYATLLILSLVGAYGAFHDRPDLRSLAWLPMLLTAIVATPFVLFT